MGSCDAGSSPRLVLSMEDTKLKRESFYWYWLLFLETSKKKEKRAQTRNAFVESALEVGFLEIGLEFQYLLKKNKE